MPRQARARTVSTRHAGTYHLYTRCVRGLHLFGRDAEPVADGHEAADGNPNVPEGLDDLGGLM